MVHVGEAPLRVQHEKCIGQAFQRVGQPCLQPVRACLCLFAGGNVVGRAMHANDGALTVAHRLAHDTHPAIAALGRHDLHLFVKRRAVPGAGFEAVDEDVAPAAAKQPDGIIELVHGARGHAVDRRHFVGPQEAARGQVHHPAAHHGRTPSHLQERAALALQHAVHAFALGNQRAGLAGGVVVDGILVDGHAQMYRPKQPRKHPHDDVGNCPTLICGAFRYAGRAAGPARARWRLRTSSHRLRHRPPRCPGRGAARSGRWPGPWS